MHHSNQDSRKKCLPKSLFIRDAKTQAIREVFNYFLWKKTPTKFLFQRQLLQLSMKQHLPCQQFTLHEFTWPEKCSLFLIPEQEEYNVQSGKISAMY